MAQRLIEENSRTIVKCSKCGYSEVEIRAWISPNDNNSFSFYYDGNALEDTETCYCRECGEWTKPAFEKVKIPPTNLLRCNVCGSLHVECRKWSDVNTGEEAAGDDSIAYRCMDCDNENVAFESEYIQRVEEWWNYAASNEKQDISGIQRTDYQDDKQFREACLQFWNNKTSGQKIDIWRKRIYPEY